MNITTQEFYYPSSSSIFNVYAKEWTCEKPKAIIQISHGMTEHIRRYDEFANFLAENGFIVCGNDHIGHGNSINDDGLRGYFGEKNGDKFLVEDVHRLTTITKTKHPQLPCFLFGHSMGSFIARMYLSSYASELKGVLLCGTSGTNPFADVGIRLSEAKIKLLGSKKTGDIIDKIVFKDLNKSFEELEFTFHWTTRDKQLLDKNIRDETTQFVFTNAGFRDLFTLLKNCNEPNWENTFSKDLPICILSGYKDPVGGFGAGVYEVYNRFEKAGFTDVTLKMYHKARHELVHELNRHEVFADTINWINRRL